MLTLEQAEARVREGFRQTGAPELEIFSAQTIERPFGWVFITATAGAEPKGGRAIPRNPIVFVNNYSGQILFTSTAFFIQRCIDTYEAVLKSLGEEWCLTLRPRMSGRFNPISFKHALLRRQLEKLGLCELPVPPLHERKDASDVVF